MNACMIALARPEIQTLHYTRCIRRQSCSVVGWTICQHENSLRMYFEVRMVPGLGVEPYTDAPSRRE